MNAALVYDYYPINEKNCAGCGNPMVPSGTTLANITIDRGTIKTITNVEDSLPLNWECQDCSNGDQQVSLSVKLEEYLKRYNENIHRVELIYGANAPTKAIIHLAIPTGTGNKGPYNFQPPDEIYADVLESKGYQVAYRGKMYYFPTECAHCTSRECKTCIEGDVGAKWVLGQKEVNLEGKLSYDELAALLRIEV